MQPRVIRSIVPLFLLLAASPLAAQHAAPHAAPRAAPLGSVAALAPVGAQRQARAPLAAPSDTDTTSRGDAHEGAQSDTTGRLRTVYSPGERFAMRSVMGALGWAGGALLGGYAGVALLGTNCNCDDPGLDSFVTGAAVGGIVGTALVVSAMGYGDRCAGPTRFVLAAGGAAVGTVAGVFLGFSGAGGGHPFLVIPIVGGLGGAGGAALCTAEGPAHRHR